MKDYSRLYAAAKQATPGKWTAYDTHGKRFIEAVGTEDHIVCAKPKKQWLKDSEYIALANPETLKELISELLTLRNRSDITHDRAYRDGLKRGFDLGENGRAADYQNEFLSYHSSILQVNLDEK